MNTSDHTVSKKQERTIQISERTEDESVIDPTVSGTSDDKVISVEDDPVAQERKPLTDRVLEQIKQEDPVVYEKATGVYERIAKDGTTSELQEDDNGNAGNVLLIIALIFAIICTAFIIKGNNIPATDNSAAGCALALAAATFYILFGLVFGIIALILLIIGLIVKAAASSEE
jgi:hypothetical protein